MTIGIDVSNYTSALTPVALNTWKAAGVGLVIVQAIDPPPGYPVGETAQQCQAVVDAGDLALDAYLYLWFGEAEAAWRRKLALLDGFPIRRLWLDVEDTTPGFTPVQRIASVAAALRVCDRYPTRLNPTGIYTGRWWWVPYVSNTTAFADRPWWPSQYDYIADTTQITPYGGWAKAVLKQYAGTSVFGGVSGVDLNVLSTDEDANLFPGGDPTMAIHVGDGMAARMKEHNDAPLKGHRYYAETDDQGSVYEIEECWGQLGLYISANSSGEWVNAGPIG